MECGEIDFAMLLDEQRGKALNFNFVGLYWQQVCFPSPLLISQVWYETQTNDRCYKQYTLFIKKM